MKSKEAQSTPYGFIDASRTIRKLSEVCVPKDGIQTGPFGSQLHSSDYVEDGIPIITVEHLGENIIEGKKPPLVNADDVQRLVKYTLKEGDIVFSRVGSVDRRALVTKAQNGWMFSGRLLRVRPEPELADPRYLSYFFGLPMFKTYIRSIAVGATMPSLNTGLLSDLPVILPEILEQQVIGNVLSALDEKIRINKALSKTLEDMAQLIFKSWFVDFDPVKAKMEGTQPAGMDAASAALFPDSLEDSEIGLIPKGWNISNLGNYIKVTKGKSYKSSELEMSNTALVTLKSFMRGGGYRFDGLKPFSGDYKIEQVVEPGELIVSFTDVTQAADVIGKPAIVLQNPKFSKLVASLDVGIVRVVGNKIGKNYLYQLFSTPIFKNHIDGYTNGTTVLHLGKGALEDFEIAMPNENLMNKFEELATSMNSQTQVLYLQNLVLGEIRDSLLPRLISGELQIPEEMLAS